MEALVKFSTQDESWLLKALLCSALLHLVLAFIIPNFKFDPIKTLHQELKIEIVNPKQPEPAPAVIPELPKPVTSQPEPVKPKPVPQKIKPDPIVKPEKVIAPEPITPTSESAPPPPEVIAVSPKVESKPAFVAPPPPPPEPPKVTGPSEGDINAARNAYRNQVQNELKRNQRYPKLAQQRGIQGNVSLDIGLDHNGNVTNVTVAESSGNESLDKAAIEAVKRSELKQFMPDILRGHIDTITVTLNFKLVSE
ncbi:MAG TPA: hypothetical protein DCO68_00075 [Methylophilaceae bacterium]|nr:hypothetical protein [Methylophilaceae bacterium]